MDESLGATPVAPASDCLGSWVWQGLEESLRRLSHAAHAALILPRVPVSADLLNFCQAYRNVHIALFLPEGADMPGPNQANLTFIGSHEVRKLHASLSTFGPVDVLVEVAGRSAERLLMDRLLWHVRSGGEYLIDFGDAGLPAQISTGDWPADRVEALVALLTPGTVATPRHSGFAGLLKSIASADVRGTRVVLTRAGDMGVKLRHTSSLLRRPPGVSWCRIVGSAPASTLDTSAVIGTHNSEELRQKLYPMRLESPALLVREYDAVVAYPHGVLVRGNYILPDTFRLWMSNPQRHRFLPNYGQHFASLPQAEGPVRVLEGQYFHLSLEYPVHFGHFMTDGVARLWAWPAAKKRNPALKLLVGALLPYQWQVLQGFGIQSDDVVVETRPVEVESLVSAMPAFCVKSYVHERLRSTYRRLQRGVESVDSPGGELIFLTRTPGLWRECVNAAEVEDYFVARGFALHRPELYSIPKQAALFRDARVVAGYIGSQFCGQIFSPNPLQLIGLTNRSYPSSNEFMMAAVLGHTLHQFWGVEQPGRRAADSKRRPVAGAHQDYAFDFQHDLPALDRVMADLLPLGRQRGSIRGLSTTHDNHNAPA